MSVNVLYKTSAKATGGRDGHAATLDGALDVKLTRSCFHQEKSSAFARPLHCQNLTPLSLEVACDAAPISVHLYAALVTAPGPEAQ